jgi:DNA-binding transcriptional regulator GbsR (MarR family)
MIGARSDSHRSDGLPAVDDPPLATDVPSITPAATLTASPAHPLTPLETEVIDLFAQLAKVMGFPRSLAEIYGLLFISPRPLNMDDLIHRLELSKGSASQGLKFLRNAGAVRTVYIPGDRRVHYQAVAELRRLVARFLSDQIVPHLESGQERLERMAAMAKNLPGDDRIHATARIGMLQSWRNRSHRFLPVLVKMMGD